jgi:predicted transposase/invertase (TIGR01784 family)
MAMDHFIRFDWAAKRLLRQKSNFVVLEGLLSTLLNEDIRIERMLESEGNQNQFDDKFNRVDMLAENSRGELIIVEIQNNRELDYFHRMLYGVSKAVTEYISIGEPYSNIRKLYSVNIVYFDLGQGSDYVYHGTTEFRGIHCNDILKLSDNQQKQFRFIDAGKLFPEYYVLRVDEFDKKAVTPLDEWIAFLKTGEIPNNAKAKGLHEARERLRIDKLSLAEKKNMEPTWKPCAINEVSFKQVLLKDTLRDTPKVGSKVLPKEKPKEKLKEKLKEKPKEKPKVKKKKRCQ